MSQVVEFPLKQADATVPLTFDFTSELPSGVTVSAATTTCTVWSGTDASPQSVVDGAASISGTVVTQVVTGGVNGVIYLLECKATGSDGNIYPLQGYLAVTTALP